MHHTINLEEPIRGYYSFQYDCFFFWGGLERYSHGGYLIKVVVMALAGEVTRELSPILSWSNNNYKI